MAEWVELPIQAETQDGHWIHNMSVIVTMQKYYFVASVTEIYQDIANAASVPGFNDLF